MATAKRNPAKTETKVIEIQPETFTLTLSREEAEIIASLVGHTVSTVPVQSIFEALYNLDVNSYAYDVLDNNKPATIELKKRK